MHLIFIGYPGSGKGTVAKLLPQYEQISTGDLLRQEVAKKSDLGKQIDAFISQGKLIDDNLALSIIKANFNPQKQYIFDGFPRTLTQAKMLVEQVLKDQEYKVVHFEIDKSLLTERIINRRSCLACGSIYNLKFKAPKKSNECDHCHATLSHRKDDTLEVVENRFKVFEETAPSMLTYFQKDLIVVDGSAEGSVSVKKILG